MSETSTLDNFSEQQNLSKRQEQLDILEQLLKPEVQDSLTILVEQLPKLTEMAQALTKYYDVAQSLATDETLKNDTISAVSEIAAPIVGTVKNVAATAIEAKDRAEGNHDVIGLFGMLRMLKDPQVQKMFRFVNAYLEVVSERESEKKY
ncbi:DUF1641 domain-containing protein [Niallia sp. Krafla_26]|uniref:DUF1641 domain-containing protein n=1 Tax=Niallia sp. Krafla_26 TaxID=3064703 RepID=UPI003D16736C